MHCLQMQTGEWAGLKGTTAIGNLGWISIIDLTTVGAKPEKQELQDTVQEKLPLSPHMSGLLATADPTSSLRPPSELWTHRPCFTCLTFPPNPLSWEAKEETLEKLIHAEVV